MRNSTCGLITVASTHFAHMRRLVCGGELLVTPGQVVEPASLVGLNSSAELLHYLRVEIDEDKMLAKMLKEVGDEVKRGEPVAYFMYMFGLGYREYISPVNGTIITINERNGFVGIREHPETVPAGLHGQVTEVVDGYGALIAGQGAVLEGLAGWGATAWGPLHLAVSGPQDVADHTALGHECRGKVVYAGAFADAKVLQQAYRHGARALIAGGVDQLAADEFTAFAAAMTLEEFQTRYYSAHAAEDAETRPGQDRVLMPVIAIDGLGATPLRDGAWEILQTGIGRPAFVDAGGDLGTGGQGRPLVIIAEAEATALPPTHASGAVEAAVLPLPGAAVRLLGGLMSGRSGEVRETGVEMVLETGQRIRGVRVAISGGGEAVVPAANLEVVVGRW